MPRNRPNLTLNKLSAVQRQHILDAVDICENKGLPGNYKPSTDYDLVLEDGRRFSPLAIMALAYSLTEGGTLPRGLRGGEGTATFAVFRKLGFEVSRKFNTEGDIVTVSEILDFINVNEGRLINTSGGRAKFKVYKKEKGIEFFVESSGKGRLHRWTYLDRVTDQFNLVRSFKQKHYDHLTVNASYHLALIREVLIEKGHSDSDIYTLSAFGSTTDRDVLEDRTRRIQGLKSRSPAKGNKKPRKFSKQTESYERDPAVRADVLDRANGFCELCKEPAPFVKGDGEPFLEVHHIIPLAEKGPDTVENGVGLCPNCHREVHYGKASKELSRRLKRNN
jgi:hypothetical protein